MRRLYRNEKGSVPFTACFVLAVMVLTMCLMLWVTTEISVISARNHIKNELANVSVRISEDTYRAMSEGDLDEYYRVLTSDASYQAELKQIVLDGIATSADLDADTCRVSGITLLFEKKPDGIEYILRSRVECRLALFGDERAVRSEQIELTGSQKIKGRD